MFFSGGKQTIHKVSAAFIVKNCHPQTSLSLVRLLREKDKEVLFYESALPHVFGKNTCQEITLKENLTRFFQQKMLKQ